MSTEITVQLRKNILIKLNKLFLLLGVGSFLSPVKCYYFFLQTMFQILFSMTSVGSLYAYTIKCDILIIKLDVFIKWHIYDLRSVLWSLPRTNPIYRWDFKRCIYIPCPAESTSTSIVGANTTAECFTASAQWCLLTLPVALWC